MIYESNSKKRRILTHDLTAHTASSLSCSVLAVHAHLYAELYQAFAAQAIYKSWKNVGNLQMNGKYTKRKTWICAGSQSIWTYVL